MRAFGRDRIRAEGIMATGTCDSRMEGRTHGRTNQPIAAASKTPCQRTFRSSPIPVVAPVVALSRTRTAMAIQSDLEHAGAWRFLAS
jgi:hypothetical protein